MVLKIVLLFSTFITSATLAQMKPSDFALESLPSRTPQTAAPHTQPASNSGVSAVTSPAEDLLSPAPKSKVKSSQHSYQSISEDRLPQYAVRKVRVDQVRRPSVIPKNTDFDSLVSLKRGEVLRAVIATNLAVYPGSKSPVTARVIGGKHAGAFLVGQATLDKTTKRANILFTGIRPLKAQEVYAFHGELTSTDGIMGLEGVYETSYWTYLLAEAATNMVAGFAKASVPQSQTAFGTYSQEPGLKAQTANAVAEGLSTTADRLGEKAKNAPEITTVAGPIVVDVIVTKQGDSNGN